MEYPYSIQWNLGVQHVFLNNFTADVRYVGTRGVHLNVQNRINVVDVVTPNQFLPTYFAQPSPSTLDALPLTLADLEGQSHFNPAYTNAGFTNPIVAFEPWGDSIYHGLQTQLNRRFANGLQFQAAYTWSHAIDNSTADFFSTIVSPRRPQDFQDLAAERGNSLIDLVTALPFPRFTRSRFSARAPVGWLGTCCHFQLAPVYTYKTGQWGTVQSAVDSNLNGDNAGDRVILNAGGVKGTGSGVTASRTAAGNPGNTLQWRPVIPTSIRVRMLSGI